MQEADFYSEFRKKEQTNAFASKILKGLQNAKKVRAEFQNCYHIEE
jgi:hypothetical protein